MKNGNSTCQHSKAETPSGVYAVGSPPGADDGRRERKDNMALHWQWEDKCGEATLVQMHEGEDDKVFTLSLYPGNAYLIMLHEREEDGKDVWSMFGFWADKDHMKNMLGLNKKDGYTDNYYDSPYQKITKIRLNKTKCRYFKEIMAALAQAFDDLTVEIYSE